MRFGGLTAFAAALAVLSASSAQASTIFTDRGAWQAATTGETAPIDASSGADNTVPYDITTSFGTFHMAQGPGDSSSITTRGAVGTLYEFFTTAGQTITIDMTLPTSGAIEGYRSIGWDYVTADDNNQTFVTVTFLMGSTVVDSASLPFTSSTRVFRGFTTTATFDRVLFESDSSAFMSIDDIQFGSAVNSGVPEPGSLALLGLGAVSLIARRRRK